MKKQGNRKLFIFILILLVPALAFSQINIGVKAGVNSNSFRPEDKVRFFVGQQRIDNSKGNGQSGKSTLHNSDKSVFGFNAGVYANYKVLDFLSARAEVLYFMQGGTVEDYSVYGSILTHTDAKVTLHTIQVPVLAEFTIPSFAEKSFQPKLLVGGYYGMKLNATESYTEKMNFDGQKSSRNGSSDVSSSFSNNQGGWIAGVGCEFGKKFLIELRYTQNLATMNTSGAKYTHLVTTIDNYNGKLRTSTLSLNVAMKLFEF